MGWTIFLSFLVGCAVGAALWNLIERHWPGVS